MVYWKPKPSGLMIRGAVEIYPLMPPNQNLAVQFVYDFDSFVVHVIFYPIKHAKEIKGKVDKLRLEGVDF